MPAKTNDAQEFETDETNSATTSTRKKLEKSHFKEFFSRCDLPMNSVGDSEKDGLAVRGLLTAVHGNDDSSNRYHYRPHYRTTTTYCTQQITVGKYCRLVVEGLSTPKNSEVLQ
jgi:hypothetical protein